MSGAEPIRRFLSAVRLCKPSVPASAQIDSTRNVEFVNAVQRVPRRATGSGSYQGMSWAGTHFSRPPRQAQSASEAGGRIAVSPKASSSRNQPD